VRVLDRARADVADRQREDAPGTVVVRPRHRVPLADARELRDLSEVVELRPRLRAVDRVVGAVEVCLGLVGERGEHVRLRIGMPAHIHELVVDGLLPRSRQARGDLVLGVLDRDGEGLAGRAAAGRLHQAAGEAEELIAVVVVPGSSHRERGVREDDAAAVPDVVEERLLRPVTPAELGVARPDRPEVREHNAVVRGERLGPGAAELLRDLHVEHRLGLERLAKPGRGHPPAVVEVVVARDDQDVHTTADVVTPAFARTETIARAQRSTTTSGANSPGDLVISDGSYMYSLSYVPR
jgi:hypothetical protein